MKKIFLLLTIVVIVLIMALFIPTNRTASTEIRVASASNFMPAMKKLVKTFETRTGQKVTLIFGSTGKHYAQIKNGAPFDIFFAADMRRPQLLEQEGIAVPGSRFTYAVGKIVLWSLKANYVDTEGNVLERMDYNHLALANPKLAPYGKAGRQILEKRKLWNKLKKNIVRGENIGQAFQFVRSGNAELGFIAYSQLKNPEHPIEGSWWIVPQELYSPIIQQAILLQDSKPARDFLIFVKSKEASKIIEQYGYDRP